MNPLLFSREDGLEPRRRGPGLRLRLVPPLLVDSFDDALLDGDVVELLRRPAIVDNTIERESWKVRESGVKLREAERRAAARRRRLTRTARFSARVARFGGRNK